MCVGEEIDKVYVMGIYHGSKMDIWSIHKDREMAEEERQRANREIAGLGQGQCVIEEYELL